MKNLKTLVVLAFVATTFSTAFAAYTPTMQLEEKIDSVAMKLVTIVESKFDGDFDTVLDVLEKFESKVQGNERNEWILETLQTNLKASMKSMMTDDDGVMDDGVMDEDDMTNKTKVFDISGTNFSFSENEIVVHEGDTVTINFSSESGFHDWVVGEFDAATDQISAGDTTSVTFVADKSGSFEFYCSVGNHRAQGMIGTLVVEAKDMMEEGMNHSDTMMDNDDMMKGTGLENVVGATSIRGVSFDGKEVGYGYTELKDGVTHVYASFQDLPDAGDKNFYEGWIVRTSPLSVLSTGELEVKDGMLVNHFTAESDISDHTFYVLTLEPRDNDPEAADHILEGNV